MVMASSALKYAGSRKWVSGDREKFDDAVAKSRKAFSGDVHIVSPSPQHEKKQQEAMPENRTKSESVLKAEESFCHLVDGPANLRNAINGKIVLSIPNMHLVRVTQETRDWVQVEYLGDVRALNCRQAVVLKTGWTHKKNLLK
jgi:hypothetical protein